MLAFEELDQRLEKLVDCFEKKILPELSDQIFITTKGCARDSGDGSESGNNTSTTLIAEIIEFARQAQRATDSMDAENRARISMAVDGIERLEIANDLNLVFDFNTHMLFHRLMQVVNCKLDMLVQLDLENNGGLSSVSGLQTYLSLANLPPNTTTQGNMLEIRKPGSKRAKKTQLMSPSSARSAQS